MAEKKISEATCWGNTPACFYLEQRLNEIGDEKLVYRCTKHILNATALFRGLKDLPRKEFYLKLVKDNVVNGIKNDTTVREELKSTVRNIIIAKYRQILKGVPSSNDKRKLRKK